MSKIAIVTDSTAYLPSEWVAQYQVRVVPLKVHWGDETYLDGVDILPQEFYERLAHSKSLPTTSQPSVHDFLQVFESLADQSDGIVVLLISSGISGTVNSARAAAREFSRLPVEIVDTRVTSTGQALAVLAAARAAVQGKSLQEVRQAADEVVQRLRIFFAVDTLEYLHRGGRIGGASRFLGTALNIKPILYFNPEGKLDALERVRTRVKALRRLEALVGEAGNGHPLHVGIMHASAPQAAQEFCEQISRRFHCQEIFAHELSPVIGTHVGPGTIGIAFYSQNT
jgi:DegV family protein with EDD domain